MKKRRITIFLFCLILSTACSTKDQKPVETAPLITITNKTETETQTLPEKTSKQSFSVESTETTQVAETSLVNPTQQTQMSETEPEPSQSEVGQKAAWTVADLLKLKVGPQYADLTMLKNVVNANQDMDFIAQVSVNYPDLNSHSTVKDDLLARYMQKTDAILTQDQAWADIDYLASLMLKAFGGLNQFGGEARVQEMVERLQTKIPAEGLTHNDFFELLSIEASFIEDSHFWINDQAPVMTAALATQFGRWSTDYRAEDYRLYSPQYTTNLKLEKTQDGFYREKGSQKLIETDDVTKKMIQPFLSESMELFYTLVIADNFSPIEEVKQIKFEDGSVLSLQWQAIEQRYFIQELPELAEQSGAAFDQVYVVNFRDNSFQSDDPPRYLEMGKQARQYPYLIIDLRDNRGGHENGGNTFLDSLVYDVNTHQFERSYYVINPLRSEDRTLLQTTDPGSMIGDRHTFIEPVRVAQTDTKQTIIVLMDRQTASAGEYFVGRLRAYHNVVVIGENTNGLATSGIGLLYVLPASGISLRIPQELAYWHPDYYNPKRGFLPDVWVDQYFNLPKLIDYLNQ